MLKKKKRTPTTFPTALGHYFQASMYSYFPSEIHCNASEFQEKEGLGGFTAVYLQSSDASQEYSDQNMMDSFRLNPCLQSLLAAATDALVRS